MNSTASRLILILRISYIVGASLFLLDVLAAGAVNALVDVAGTVPPSDQDALESAMDWVAVIAFGFVAVGAVVTVLATSELLRGPADGRPPRG